MEPSADTRDSCIFHITTREAAEAARTSGEYRAASLDSEGFVHFSRARQVPGTAARFYAGRKGLVVLVTDPTLLDAPLRYEVPSGGGEAYPHLHGPLNFDAVIDVAELDRFSGEPVHADTAAALRHFRFGRLPVEGTLYQSTWRSPLSREDGRPAGTAMLGLYAESPESVSCFHRLRSDEVWHACGGDPFALYLLCPGGRTEEILMGTDLARGQRPQFVVPAGCWQAGCLVPGGRYALFGCTMAPGFTGAGFEAGLADELVARYPDREAIIRRLSTNDGQRLMPDGFSE